MERCAIAWSFGTCSQVCNALPFETDGLGIGVYRKTGVVLRNLCSCLPVLLPVLSVLSCLLQSAAVSRIMSRTPRSPGPPLETLEEELREKERFMSHGYQSFQYLLEALKSSGHSQCTTVWTKDTVAYRCRTCQTNDSRSAAALAFVFFHTTSISPTSSPPCRLLAIWMWFLDASFFAFFLQFSVVHDCQGDIHVENGSSADCIGDEGSLISHCFRNAVYNSLN